MAIILSIEESENQIISGFPEYVILSSNISSTIFYTLDGTDPDDTSDMFVDQLSLPTTGLILTLKAIAISDSESSAILEETYFTVNSELNRGRDDDEGINILPYGAEVIDYLSFDEDGEPAQTTSIEFDDLDLIGSTTNIIGEDIEGSTTIDFINFALPFVMQESPTISSPNDDNTNFDPKAQYIIIDGTTQDKIDNQVVRIINRPHGSMDSLSPIHNSNQYNYQIVSANLVRYMMNTKTGIITFYYRDSRENRWIKSTQQLEQGTGNINITTAVGHPNSFVFRWIENRTQSLIF